MIPTHETVGNVFFTLLVIVTVVPAALVVLTLNIVRSACWLLVSLSGAAGLFFLLGADFVGGTQLLIYVGGTLVLVIFGVMLTATGPFVNLSSRGGDWALSIIAGVLLFVTIAYAITATDSQDKSYFPPPVDHLPQITTNRIGMALMGMTPDTGTPGARPSLGYLLPFEIVSVHLVVVLIGAAYLARAKQRQKKESAA